MIVCCTQHCVWPPDGSTDQRASETESYPRDPLSPPPLAPNSIPPVFSWVFSSTPHLLLFFYNYHFGLAFPFSSYLWWIVCRAPLPLSKFLCWGTGDISVPGFSLAWLHPFDGVGFRKGLGPKIFLWTTKILLNYNTIQIQIQNKYWVHIDINNWFNKLKRGSKH